MRKLQCMAACFSLAAFAALANGQDRPNFSGNWQFDSSKSELHNLKLSDATWSIQESDDTIHLTLNEGGKPIDFKCTTDGKDCNENAEKAKASFWFNGPMLVEMETKGDHVMRYRLKLSDDGKTLRVESNSIVPKDDATDVLVFTKKS